MPVVNMTSSYDKTLKAINFLNNLSANFYSIDRDLSVHANNLVMLGAIDVLNDVSIAGPQLRANLENYGFVKSTPADYAFVKEAYFIETARVGQSATGILLYFVDGLEDYHEASVRLTKSFTEGSVMEKPFIALDKATKTMFWKSMVYQAKQCETPIE